MKNKFVKLISSLLVIAFVVSAVPVFTFAENSDSEISLLINRDFEEGWDYNNGFSAAAGDNLFSIDYEETSDYNYNYFFRMEAANANAATLTFDFTSQFVVREGGTVLEISYKADDYCNVIGNSTDIGKILSVKTNIGQTINLIGIKDGKLCVYTNSDGTEYQEICELDNDWSDLAFVFDWDKSDLYYTLYYGEDYSEKFVVSYPYSTSGDKGLRYCYLEMPKVDIPADAEQRVGASYCVDNFKIYQGTKDILSAEELDEIGYGERIDPMLEKTVTILSSSDKGSDQLLQESLCMKIGVDYALFKNVRQPIFFDETTKEAYGAPEKIDGHVMVPFGLMLDYIGFPYHIHDDGISYDITTGTSKTNLVAGRDSASVNGERVALTVAPGFVTSGDNQYLVLALEDIETLFPGWLVTYDDMGLIIIYEDLSKDSDAPKTEILTRENDLSAMVDLMKKFVFDTVTVDDNGKALKQVESYVATGSVIYDDVKKTTDNFKHPYIGATQSKFDRLNLVYSAMVGTDDYNAVAKNYLDILVGAADEFYNSVAVLDSLGAYSGISEEKIPVNVYKDGNNPSDENPDVVADTTDGYSAGTGRIKEIVEYTASLVDLAFAYQVTRDAKYALLAYDWAIALGQWEHWGPAYMTDCAEATYNFALAYDWLYNAIKTLKGQEAIDELAVIIYEKGVYDGYVSSMGQNCEHPRNLGDQSKYISDKTSRNAVSAAGMIVGALTIMDKSEYSDVVTYLVGNNIINLMNNGLDMYAPDGSYIESATYWSYGTNYLFRLMMALDTSAGKDYGLVDTWGLDTTCYYACHIESSDGFIWNYHDAGADGVVTGKLASQDTQMFNFAGQLFGDSALVSIRNQHLTSVTNPKSVTIYDMLFFPFDGIEEAEELPLDYHMEGIDAFVSRSDWEAGAMYTGLMGGANNAYHGQLDSGNFIYHNKGIVWFMDLGSEEYGVAGYFGSQRNNYYRANAEGQNIVAITSDATNLKFGQYSGAGGSIIKTHYNEHGSYAILDNAPVYREDVVTAYRGILVTNDRTTVVIQDEIKFGTKVQDMVWIAHTAQEIEISEDGRTAYLTSQGEDGETYTLRASLVSDVKTFKFSVRAADDLIFSGVTYGPGDSETAGGLSEYSRAGIQRLVIECKNAPNFDAAVVIEMVDGKNSNEPVKYKWKNLANWMPSNESFEATGDEPQLRDSIDKENVKIATDEAIGYLNDNIAFTEKLNELYAALTLVEYTLEMYNNNLGLGYEDAFDNYDVLYDEYEAFREQANEVINVAYDFSYRFQGINDEVYEEETEEEPDGEGEPEGEE